MSNLKQALQSRPAALENAAAPRSQEHLTDYLRPPSKTKLVREHAFSAVRDAIVDGRLEPGTRLVERELCEALDISRSLVREIIRELEAERLIEVMAHRGPRVARLTPRLVREIYLIRAELEVMFVREFMRVADTAQIAALRHIQADLEVAGQNHDKARMVEVITHLLGHMVSVADNRVGAEIYDRLLSRINMLRIISMSEPGQIEVSIDHITRLIRHIELGDQASAEAMLRTSNRQAGESAIAQLTQRPGRDVKPRV